MADKHSGNPGGAGRNNRQNQNGRAKSPAIRRIPATAKSPEIRKPQNLPNKKQDAVRKPAPSRPTPGAGQVRKPAQATSVHRTAAARSSADVKKRKTMAAVFLIVTVLLIAVLVGFGLYQLFRFVSDRSSRSTSDITTTTTQVTTTISETTTSETTTEATTSETTTEATTETTTESTTTEPTPTPSPTPNVTPFPAGGPDLSGYRVVLDAGHQEKPNHEPEAMSRSMGGSKDKSSQGFIGVVSGKDESEINLSVELLLASYLRSLGADVTVTREQNDVNISNKERAELAVSKEPELYIRLFCNAANDSAAKGCEVIVPSSGKYASEVKTWGESLGKKLEEITLSTFNGCKASGNYAGLNWADSIPSFMIRMGYLSNSDDEALLLSEEYQFKFCKGVAEFIATMPKK